MGGLDDFPEGCSFPERHHVSEASPGISPWGLVLPLKQTNKIPFPVNLILGPNFSLKAYTGKKKNLFQEHSKYLKERLVFAYLLYPKPKHP